MSEEPILYSVDNSIAAITLNRPAKLNAFNDAMTQALINAFKQADRDEAVRVVVLTGAGRAFSSGQDLGEFQHSEALIISEHLRHGYNKLIGQMRNLEKPILGVINGVTAGAALGVALATDIRIASEDASLICAFVRIGLVPDTGTSWLLTQMLGPAKALELMLTGDAVPAQEALNLGLVNRVVPAGDLEETAQQWAQRLANGPTRAYGLTKRIANKAATASLEETLDYEAMLQDVAGATADHKEGVAAFLEKREAKFTGK